MWTPRLAAAANTAFHFPHHQLTSGSIFGVYHIFGALNLVQVEWILDVKQQFVCPKKGQFWATKASEYGGDMIIAIFLEFSMVGHFLLKEIQISLDPVIRSG